MHTQRAGINALVARDVGRMNLLLTMLVDGASPDFLLNPVGTRRRPPMYYFVQVTVGMRCAPAKWPVLIHIRQPSGPAWACISDPGGSRSHD